MPGEVRTWIGRVLYLRAFFVFGLAALCPLRRKLYYYCASHNHPRRTLFRRGYFFTRGYINKQDNTPPLLGEYFEAGFLQAESESANKPRAMPLWNDAVEILSKAMTPFSPCVPSKACLVRKSATKLFQGGLL